METVVVTAGAVGVAEVGHGSTSVVLDIGTMDREELGRAISRGFQAAATDAVRDFLPHLNEAWRQRNDRQESWEPETEP